MTITEMSCSGTSLDHLDDEGRLLGPSPERFVESRILLFSAGSHGTAMAWR